MLSGTATHTIHNQNAGNAGLADGGRIETIDGKVEGTMNGKRFAVKIFWNNGTVGVYDGTVGLSGRLEGTGYKQGSSSVKVNWHSVTTMKCADKKVGAGAPDWMKAAPPPSPTPRGVTPGPEDYKALQEAVNKAAATSAVPPASPIRAPGPEEIQDALNKASGRAKPATQSEKLRDQVNQDQVNKASAKPAPIPSAETDESEATDTDQHKKKKGKKKNKHKKRHHHQDEDENQGND
jgi:hypothetical protein